MSESGNTTDRPRIAEEIVDLQTITELFQGKEDSTTTGRALLHAVSATSQADLGQTLCGRALGADEITPIDRVWDLGYLPHLPRCEGCSTAAGTPSQPEAHPAGDVDIRTAHGSDTEKAGADGLRAVLGEYDVRRWMSTDLVTVDDDILGGLSHPMTVHPRLLAAAPTLALTTFLHEQVHWLRAPGIDAATTEASQRWPDPPLLPAGGHTVQSAWLHISICGLEYLSLSEMIGAAEAEAELRSHRIYSWMYEQVLADVGWLTDFLARHDLRVPSQVPVPRRFVGRDWREVLASLS